MRALCLFVAATNLFAQESSYRWIRQLGGSEENVAIGVAVDSGGNTYVATLNSPSNPVAEGDPITIFVTGGAVGVPVSVTVDGFAAKSTGVTSGQVDGLPGVVYKVAAVVPRPSDMADQNPILKGFKMPPIVPVQVTMGIVKSQNGITLSVK